MVAGRRAVTASMAEFLHGKVNRTKHLFHVKSGEKALAVMPEIEYIIKFFEGFFVQQAKIAHECFAQDWFGRIIAVLTCSRTVLAK